MSQHGNIKLDTLQDNDVEFPQVDTETCFYDSFFNEYLVPNKPCLFTSKMTETWRSRKEWVDDFGKPNFTYICHTFGKNFKIVSILHLW